MAIGDKKPVVMDEQLGQPNGVATLGTDGKLAEAQRPTADGVKLADGTTIAAAIAAEAAAREQGLAGKAAASHAAQHAANGSDPITPQSIGAAPGGGGVMERALTIASTSSDDDYDAFCAKLDTILASMPNNSVKFLQVYPPQYYWHGYDMCALYKANNDYASVYTIGSYNADRQGFRMIKNKSYSSYPAGTGKWRPLEYINPEMDIGVEYRTTERYFGKPVYVKVVNFGALPNAGIKDVEHGLTNVSSVWIDSSKSVIANSSQFPLAGGTNLLPIHPGITRIILRINSDSKGVITVDTNMNLSAYRAAFCIKYTKSTD